MKCSYCGNELPRNGGMMYVFHTGKINYYCSGRCYKYDIVMHRKLKKKAKATIAARPAKPDAQKPETPKQKT